MAETKKLPKLIIPMGKTATSKDTISKVLLEAFSIQPIVSYSTRPIRDNEYDGVEHWFVDDKKMDDLMLDKSELLAYAYQEKTGYRYCATVHGLPNPVYTYTLNPNAYLQMIKDHPELETLVIFCDLPEYEIKRRAKLRGDKQKDISIRLDSERNEFEEFKACHFTNSVYTGEKGITVNDVDLSNQKLYMISTLNPRFVVTDQVIKIVKDAGFACYGDQLNS